MKRWANVINNNVDCVVEQNSQPNTFNALWVECPNWVGPQDIYTNGTFKKFVPPPLPKIITKIAFRLRFTDAEYTSILVSAKTDAEIQAWYETFNMLSYVDLDNQRIKDGVQNLVVKNILTQPRADEILTAPVQDSERA